MRAIVRKYKPRYDSIHRSRKREIVEAAYSEITQDGARFLHKSREELTFAVVDLNVSLQKVRNTLGVKLASTAGDVDDARSLSLPETASYRKATTEARADVDFANTDAATKNVATSGEQRQYSLPQSLPSALLACQQHGLPTSLPPALFPCPQHQQVLPQSLPSALFPGRQQQQISPQTLPLVIDPTFLCYQYLIELCSHWDTSQRQRLSFLQE